MMGSAESTTRKVSFGLDDGDTVRILRGVKLSEDVLQRMRGANEFAKSQTKTTLGNKENTEPHLQSSSQQQSQSQPQPQPQPQPQATSGSTAADVSEELKRRYERQQSIIQEELARIARREREASRQDLSRAMQRERAQTRQEADKAQSLLPQAIEEWSKQLEKKEAELKALDAFYKEQIAQLEKRNVERYKATHEQFRSAATKSESHVRPRNTEAVCTSLQAQILHCYRENRDQTLRCSDLAKEYMQCIDAAKKNLLVNHG
ncbi:MICOS complex subunit mic25a-like isoform X1 [Alosa pseudoharengus]|uniref:MICOS complex subunit mic25a-like isoform X1 n=1 Tax=Alosa pseudoharengus TaxID=34774 RepID=UPI003F8BA9A4